MKRSRLALALTVALDGCGAGRSAQQIRITPGAGGQVGSVLVRDAKIVFAGPVAAGAVYQPGDDAPLQLTVVNEGTAADKLVAARSPIAAA